MAYSCLIRRRTVVLTALAVLAGFPTPKMSFGQLNDFGLPYGPDCMFPIPPAKSLTDGSHRVCITAVDVNRAFERASQLVQIPPGNATAGDTAVIAALGDLYQATSDELLKELVGLCPSTASQAFPMINLNTGWMTNALSSCPFPYRYVNVNCTGTDRFRRADGYCNWGTSYAWTTQGAAGHVLRRDLPAFYGDGWSSPRVSVADGKPLPPARVVSNLIHSRANRQEQSLTIMFVAFAQFLDHDMTLTGNFAQGQSYLGSKIDCCARPDDHRTCLPIDVPDDDPFYSKFGRKCLNFLRVLPGLKIGCALGRREQFNAVTPVIDGSAIYGSNANKANRLRDPNSKGKLRTFSPFGATLDVLLKPLLPQRTVDPDLDCIRSSPSKFCFDAGDDRVTEQPLLTTMHLIFVRAHNAIASELAILNPMWDSDRVYEETRRIVGAILQHIVLHEFLPTLLTNATLQRYNMIPNTLYRTGSPYFWNDVQISQSFSTAAFRFAHTLLPDEFILSSKTHARIGSRPLRSLFNRPDELHIPGRVDEFLLGALNQPADAFDQSISDEVRDFLFQEPGQEFGMDLAARNIQRGREHGIPGYLAYRRTCWHLPQIWSWSDMLLDFPNSTVAAFRSIYSHPADVDLWSAGIAENKAPGAVVGPTFECLIVEQFNRLISGDRFWYDYRNLTTSFTEAQLTEIKKMTFSRLLCDHADEIRTIQKKAFLLPDFTSNPRVPCCSELIPRMTLDPWRPMNPRD